MRNEPIWPSLRDLIAFNRAEVDETGENHALLRPDLLESALAVPQNIFHYEKSQDVLDLAVSLMLAVARNHPFEQGNKRTAFDAGMMLLELNGYRLSADRLEFAELFVDLLSHKADENAFVDRLRPFVGPSSSSPARATS